MQSKVNPGDRGVNPIMMSTPVSKTPASRRTACTMPRSSSESNSFEKLNAHVNASRENASVLASETRLTVDARRAIAPALLPTAALDDVSC